MRERLRLAYERFHARRDAAVALGLPRPHESVPPQHRWMYSSKAGMRYMEYEPTPTVWWWPEQKGMATLAVPNDRRFYASFKESRSRGLRFVGAVVPENYRNMNPPFMPAEDVGKLGWFDNDYGEYCDGGDGLIWGVVYQLPSRQGWLRFVAGYCTGCNDEVVLDLGHLFVEPSGGHLTRVLDSDAARSAARAADDMAMHVAEEERDYQRQQREEETMEEWLTEARRYAHHIWCYGQLIDDHIERCETAASRGEDVYEFVEWLGEKYDLTRADQDWGIHQDVPFNKEK